MSVPREFKHLSTGKHLGLYLATQLDYRAGKFDSRWLRSQNGHEESFFTKMARWCIRKHSFSPSPASSLLCTSCFLQALSYQRGADLLAA